MTTIIYIGSFLVLLGVLVTIHEFGHFIVARMCKVHVQRFSVGMGPVFYKKYDKHGTEFALSAVPLGGYVSMITNKLIEAEPDSVKDLTEEQLRIRLTLSQNGKEHLLCLQDRLQTFFSQYVFLLVLLCQMAL